MADSRPPPRNQQKDAQGIGACVPILAVVLIVLATQRYDVSFVVDGDRFHQHKPRPGRKQAVEILHATNARPEESAAAMRVPRVADDVAPRVNGPRAAVLCALQTAEVSHLARGPHHRPGAGSAPRPADDVAGVVEAQRFALAVPRQSAEVFRCGSGPDKRAPFRRAPDASDDVASAVDAEGAAVFALGRQLFDGTVARPNNGPDAACAAGISDHLTIAVDAESFAGGICRKRPEA